MADVERIADKLVKLTRPERIELAAQSRHALGVQAVVLEPSFASARDEPGLGQHAKMLRDRRPAHREVAGQYGHRLFAVPQQL